MTDRLSLTLLGNYLLGCEQCSVENNTYCVQFLKLIADLFRYIPKGTTTVADHGIDQRPSNRLAIEKLIVQSVGRLDERLLPDEEAA